MRELKYRAEEAVPVRSSYKTLETYHNSFSYKRSYSHVLRYFVCSAVCSAVSSTSNRIYILPVILKPKKLLKILVLFCARSIRGNINCMGLHFNKDEKGRLKIRQPFELSGEGPCYVTFHVGIVRMRSCD